MPKYVMTDRTVERPTCTAIRVYRNVDENPDLSWLDQTDEQMGEGFEAESRERKESYGSDWEMLHIQAEALVLIPLDGSSIIQTLHSMGVGGVESDSTPEYLTGLEDDEIDNLRQVLDALHIDHTNAEVTR